MNCTCPTCGVLDDYYDFCPDCGETIIYTEPVNLEALFSLDKDDRLFKISPDPGHPECICSRCGRQITEWEIPIRIFVDEGKGGEYRYCVKCQRGLK